MQVSQRHPHIIRRDELAEMNAQAGARYELADNSAGTAVGLHKGHILFQRLRSGLIVHTVDVIDLQQFCADIEMTPSLSFVLMLNGQTGLTAGDRTFQIGPESGHFGRGVAEGGVLALADTDRVRRTSQTGTHIRCAVVIVPPEWVETGAHAGNALQDTLFGMGKNHLAGGRWALTPRQIALAEKMLRPAQYESYLQDLYLESYAFEMVAESVRALTDADRVVDNYSLRRRDRLRMASVVDLIESKESRGLTLGEIAARVGTNVSTLQEQFRAAYGTTLIEYMREQRLAQAREALEHSGISVAEAAYMAGYRSPANFATAFKRRYGVSPKQLRIK